MFKGAFGKRFYYLLSALFRAVSFVGLLIAYIVVKIVVSPAIGWLNALLSVLSILSLATSIFNLVLSSFPATAYKEKFLIQLICFITTLLTGGIASSTFTGLAVFTKVLDEEVKNERLINTKTLKNKEGKSDEKTKK